jgi:uncharacterized protein (TIGR03083 family)
MLSLPSELLYAEIAASTAALAALVDRTDPDLPIPACPDWTLRQLGTHVGRAQRWAAEIVRARSAEFIDFRAVPDGRLPADQAARGRWLTTGSVRLVDALREAGAAEVWAFGSMQPASFWARRMAHETMVHLADAQLAAGEAVRMPAEFAADAIDEWLTTMSGPIYGRPDPRARALPAASTLHVHATDPELAGSGEWLVRHSGDGVQVTAEHGKGDVALAGPAADLLLVLLRRQQPPGPPATDPPAGTRAADSPAGADPTVRVFGDAGLLDRWLAGTSF